MIILERIEQAIRLWEILMPHISRPAESQFGVWIRFPDAAIERGFVRGSKKFAANKVLPGSIDKEQVYRYVAGVIRNEYEALKEAR